MECILLSVLQDVDTVADMADFPNIHFSSSVVGVKFNFNSALHPIILIATAISSLQSKCD